MYNVVKRGVELCTKIILRNAFHNSGKQKAVQQGT